MDGPWLRLRQQIMEASVRKVFDRTRCFPIVAQARVAKRIVECHRVPWMGSTNLRKSPRNARLALVFGSASCRTPSKTFPLVSVILDACAGLRPWLWATRDQGAKPYPNARTPPCASPNKQPSAGLIIRGLAGPRPSLWIGFFAFSELSLWDWRRLF